MIKVTQVFKTGEKAEGYINKRGIKPQGYNFYIDGVLELFIPYKIVELCKKLK